MLYTPMTCRALLMAYEAHQGQFDPCGMPYVFHPFHLAEQMDDEASTCAALLHDVVEDTAVTLDDLASLFPSEVVEAVRCLTHGPDEDYETYLTRIKLNPIALKVKRADLAHNMDETRHCTGKVDPGRISKWRAKHQKATELLNS